jgi:hypothetical protein
MNRPTSRLRARFGVALATTALFASPLAVSPVVTPAGAAAAACKKAKIAGQSKCIAAGQFCKKAAEKDYNKYGFTCNKKDANGRWHLQVR